MGALREFHAETGLAHGDPHPGNAIVDSSTGEIHFIDMGHTLPLTVSSEGILKENDMKYAENHWIRGW